MASFTIIETIDAEPNVVFDALTDLEKLPERIEGITGIELLTEGRVGVGSQFKETRVMFGKEASETMTVSELERPTRLVFTADSHGCAYVTTHSLRTENDKTVVELTFEGKPHKPIAKLLAFMMKPMMKSCEKASAQDLADLKQSLEA